MPDREDGGITIVLTLEQWQLVSLYAQYGIDWAGQDKGLLSVEEQRKNRDAQKAVDVVDQAIMWNTPGRYYAYPSGELEPIGGDGVDYEHYGLPTITVRSKESSDATEARLSARVLPPVSGSA